MPGAEDPANFERRRLGTTIRSEFEQAEYHDLRFVR